MVKIVVAGIRHDDQISGKQMRDSGRVARFFLLQCRRRCVVPLLPGCDGWNGFERKLSIGSGRHHNRGTIPVTPVFRIGMEFTGSRRIGIMVAQGTIKRCSQNSNLFFDSMHDLFHQFWHWFRCH